MGLDKPPREFALGRKAERPPANDRQVGGTHYVDNGEFQPWDFCLKWRLPFLQGLVVKYAYRHELTGLDQDVRKCAHVLDKLAEDAPVVELVPRDDRDAASADLGRLGIYSVRHALLAMLAGEYRHAAYLLDDYIDGDDW